MTAAAGAALDEKMIDLTEVKEDEHLNDRLSSLSDEDLGSEDLHPREMDEPHPIK